jgi:hypothetical protein
MRLKRFRVTKQREREREVELDGQPLQALRRTGRRLGNRGRLAAERRRCRRRGAHGGGAVRGQSSRGRSGRGRQEVEQPRWRSGLVGGGAAGVEADRYWVLGRGSPSCRPPRPCSPSPLLRGGQVRDAHPGAWSPLRRVLLPCALSRSMDLRRVLLSSCVDEAGGTDEGTFSIIAHFCITE